MLSPLCTNQHYSHLSHYLLSSSSPAAWGAMNASNLTVEEFVWCAIGLSVKVPSKLSAFSVHVQGKALLIFKLKSFLTFLMKYSLNCINHAMWNLWVRGEPTVNLITSVIMEWAVSGGWEYLKRFVLHLGKLSNQWNSFLVLVKTVEAKRGRRTALPWWS